MATSTYACRSIHGGHAWVNSGTGNFRNTTDKYLAVRFYSGTQLYYGWIRFSVTSTDTVTLKDYAYQSSGTPFILAGQTMDNYIVTSASTISPVCAGDTFNVGYVILGNFNPANVVSVEFSDSAGNFSAGTILASDTSIVSGTIPCVIPLTFLGTGYRFRVISSNPAEIAANNGTNLIVNNGLPSNLVTPTTITQLVCDSAFISAVGNINFVALTAPLGNGNSYQWIRDGVNLPGSVARIYNADTTGLFSCDISNGCGTVHSNVVSLTVYPTPVINITPAANIHYKCKNIPLVLKADSIPGGHYQWYDNNAIPITGANTRSFAPPYTSNTWYIIEVVSQHGCGSILDVGVNQGLDSMYVIPPGPLTINSGDSVVLSSSSLDPTLTYQWYRDSILIPGAIAMSYTAMDSGTYTLEIYDSVSACSQTTSGVILHVLNPTAVQVTYSVQSSLRVQPNPFSNTVSISFSIQDKQKFSVRIVDLAGRLVKTIASDVPGGGHFDYYWKADDQDGNSINSGTYFLKLEAETFSQTEKLILVR
jgi:hypothetical protein